MAENAITKPFGEISTPLSASFSPFQNKIDKVIHNSLICTTIFRAKYWPWGRPDWGEGIPYGNTTNPDFPFWKVETVDFIERRLIKEPYWWYSKNVIDGTHNEKGNNCCDFTNFFIFFTIQQVLEYREFEYRYPCNTGILLMVTIE